MNSTRFLGLGIILIMLASIVTVVPASGGTPQKNKNSVLAPEAVTKLTGLSGHEYNPDLAYGATHDQFLLAFSYSEPSGGNFLYSVQAQVVDAYSNPVGTPLVLSSNDISPREHPAIAYNSALDEFLVIWDDEYDIDDHDIYGRIISGTGSLIGSEYSIDYSSSDDSLPDLVYNPVSGEYLAVRERYYVDQSEIFANRLDANGAPTGSGFYVADDSIDESAAAVGCNTATGNYLVIWNQQTASGNYDIYGQLVTAAGVLSGGLIPISTATGDQLHPQLAYNDAFNEFLVVWQDGRSDGDIYGQRLNGSGGLIGGNFAIADLGTYYPRLPTGGIPTQRSRVHGQLVDECFERGCERLPAACAHRWQHA